MAVFAAIFLVWAVFQTAIFVVPEFAEYMYAREGWNSVSTSAREAHEFAPFIVRQLRAGVLRPDNPAEPSSIIGSAFRQHEAAVFGSAAFLWAIVGVLCYLDIASYTLFTEDKILYTDYWTSKRTEITYQTVARVETSCWINNEGDPIVDYEVYLDKDHSHDLISLADFEEETPILRIDEKLRAAGVRFRRASQRNALNNSNPFEAECLERLKERLDTAAYNRAARLLHADGAN